MVWRAAAEGRRGVSPSRRKGVRRTRHVRAPACPSRICRACASFEEVGIERRLSTAPKYHYVMAGRRSPTRRRLIALRLPREISGRGWATDPSGLGRASHCPSVRYCRRSGVRTCHQGPPDPTLTESFELCCVLQPIALGAGPGRIFALALFPDLCCVQYFCTTALMDISGQREEPGVADLFCCWVVETRRPLLDACSVSVPGPETQRTEGRAPLFPFSLSRGSWSPPEHRPGSDRVLC